MSDCQHREQNLAHCNCTYENCIRKGYCCQCLAYHRKSKEIPACFFSPQAEKTFDRSIDNFLKTTR